MAFQKAAFFFEESTEMNGGACHLDHPLGLSYLFPIAVHTHPPPSFLENCHNPRNIFLSTSLLPMPGNIFVRIQTPKSLVSILTTLRDHLRAHSVQFCSALFLPQVFFLRAVSHKPSAHKFLAPSLFPGQPNQ